MDGGPKAHPHGRACVNLVRRPLPARLSVMIPRILCGKGGRIIMACRDEEKCEAAAREIRRDTCNHHVYARRLDLASVTSIREFASRVNQGKDVVWAGGDRLIQPNSTTDSHHLSAGLNHFPSCGPIKKLYFRQCPIFQSEVLEFNCGGIYSLICEHCYPSLNSVIPLSHLSLSL